MGKRLVL